MSTISELPSNTSARFADITRKKKARDGLDGLAHPLAPKGEGGGVRIDDDGPNLPNSRASRGAPAAISLPPLCRVFLPVHPPV